MAIVCPHCGIDNRDRARFCLGCAAPLDRAVEPASTTPQRRKRRRSGPSRRAKPAWRARLAGGLALVALMVAVGVWMLGRDPEPQALRATPTAPTALESAAPQAPEATPATTAPATPETAISPMAREATQRLQASVERLAEQDREREAAHAQQARLVEQRRAEEARRRIEAEPLPRPVPPTSRPPERINPLPPTPAPAPTPTGAVGAAPPGVEQLCAADNFLSRDFCGIRECAKPANASDPLCVRFRQMEEARRQRANQR